MLALLKLPLHLGYPALVALVGLESTGVPVPGETALIAAGILARDGQLRIGYVIAAAAVAAIVGDNVGYLIGRTGGRKLLERSGFMEQRRRAIIEKGEPFFERHGPKAVFLGRWLAGLRIAAAWLAGINRMPWHVFLFYNALGGIAWAATVGLAAYELGPTAERLIKDVGLAGVAVVAITGIGVVLWHRHRRDDTPTIDAGKRA